MILSKPNQIIRAIGRSAWPCSSGIEWYIFGQPVPPQSIHQRCNHKCLTSLKQSQSCAFRTTCLTSIQSSEVQAQVFDLAPTVLDAVLQDKTSYPTPIQFRHNSLCLSNQSCVFRATRLIQSKHQRSKCNCCSCSSSVVQPSQPNPNPITRVSGRSAWPFSL